MLGRAKALRHEYPEALFYLRLGLGDAPKDRDGRLLLAQLLNSFRRSDAAQQLLVEGLQFHRHDPAYLRPLFDFLLQTQDDGLLVKLARDLLPPAPPPSDRNRIVAYAAATASFLRGNYDSAEDFLRLCLLDTTREGALLRAKLNWDRGYRDLALIELRALAVTYPQDPETHSELARRLRDSGRSDESRRLLLTFQITHPSQPSPRIALLRAYRDQGDPARVTREADSLLTDFSGDLPALLALAEFAANSPDPHLARRVLEHCRVQKLPTEAAAFFTVEALIVARDYHGALTTAHALLAENPSWARSHATLLNSLEAVAHFGLGDPQNGRLLLEPFLQENYPRADTLLAIANRLLDVGADDSAQRLLSRAVTADPLNQVALTHLIEIELDHTVTDTLSTHLRRLLALRRPSPDVLRVAEHNLGSDLFLFAADRGPTLDSVRLTLATGTKPVH